MFGHQDDPAAMPVNNDNQYNQSDATPTEPTPDVVLDGSGAMSAPDPAQEPISTPADNGIGGYIPTDQAGQPDHDDAVTPTEPSGDLLSIKQQALQQLSPLVSHLDQTPEEKFHTTMMMIQASDNQSLIKDAYEAANSITDEKTRAQALLDIINEINYFTQHQEDK